LDDIDGRIVTQLQANGRATLGELAKITGLTSMGVSKRLQKLLDRKTIKISTLLDPFSLKLLPAIVMLEMESACAMEKLLNRFRECPRVINIFKTLGGYNLIALVIAEDQDTLESISVEKCSLRSSEGIRRSEFYPIGDIHFSPFLLVRKYLTRRGKNTTPCNLDCRPCSRYTSKKCVGCPASTCYRGML
jgi:DNA-binding Lrp family transcriptional regulator